MEIYNNSRAIQLPSKALSTATNWVGREVIALKSTSPIIALIVLVAAIILYKVARYLLAPSEKTISTITDAKTLDWFKSLLNQQTSSLPRFSPILKLIDKENYADAFKALKKLSDNGDIEAALWVGIMYQYGVGIEPSKIDAITYLTSASDKGHKDASSIQLNIAAIYEDMGSISKAIEHYAAASNLGNADASYALASLYSGEENQDVKKDPNKELAYLKKAADQDHDNACYILGQMYKNGENVVQSDETALSYYKKAADMDHPEAWCALGKMHLGQHAALYYFEQAANRGSRNAYSDLGFIYYNGFGVAQSEATGLKYYSKAADMNQPDACIFMGKFHQNAKGSDQSYKKAIKYYIKGLPNVTARVKLAECQYSLKSYKEAYEQYQILAKELYPIGFLKMGDMHHHGYHVEKSEERAKELYLQAISLMHQEEKYEQGCYYYSGNHSDFEKNDFAAAIFLEEVVNSRDSIYKPYLIQAQCYAGILSHKRQDDKEALRYLNIAAENHHQEAIDYLAKHFPHPI